jgi:spermidine synthase
MTVDIEQTHVRPFVHETKKGRSLHFSIAEVQSCMSLAQPDSLDLEYTRTMMGFLLFHPMPLRIGMIGLGGGSLAKFCFRHLQQADITVIEINPHVIALRDDFAVPPDGERFRVIQADGAHFVRTCRDAFDVLLVDGYDYDGLPGELSSERFYDDACSCLRPSGVVVANIHPGPVDFPLYLERIGRSFDGAAVAVRERERGNAIVFARKDCALQSRALETVVRPGSLDAPQWKQLQAAFARIRTALREHAP